MEEKIQNTISRPSATAADTVPKRKRGRPRKSQCDEPKRKRPEQTLDSSTEEDYEPERFFKINDMKEMLRNTGEKLLRWIIEGKQTVDWETTTDMAKKIQKIKLILQEKKERAENSKSSRQQKTLDLINPLLDSATYLTTVAENYLQNCSKKEQEDAHNLSFVDIFDEQSPENASPPCPITPTRSILKTPNDSVKLRKKISFAEKVTRVGQDNETSQISLAKSSPSVKDALSNSDTCLTLNNAFQPSIQNAILDAKCQSYEEASAHLEQKNASIDLSEDMFCDDSESIIDSSFQNDSFSFRRDPSEIHVKRFTPKMSYQAGCEKLTTRELPTSGDTPEMTQASSKGNYSTFEFANQTLTNNREDSTNNVFSNEFLNSVLHQISMKETSNVVDKPPQDITLPFHNFTLTLQNSSPSSEDSLNRSVEMAINLVKGSEKTQSSETNAPVKTAQVDQSADWAWQRENSIDIVPGTEFFMGASQWIEPQWNQHLNYNVHASEHSPLNLSLLFDETDQQNCGGHLSNSSKANATNVPLSEGQIEYTEVNKNRNAESTVNTKIGSNTENQERQMAFGVGRQYPHELEKYNLQHPFGDFDVQSYAQLNATNVANPDEIYKESGSRLLSDQETIISRSKKRMDSVDSRQLTGQAIDTSMDRRNTSGELKSSFKQNYIDESSKPTVNDPTRAGFKLLGMIENHNNSSFNKGGQQHATLPINPGKEQSKTKTVDNADKIPTIQDSKMSVFDMPAQSESYRFKRSTSLSDEYGNNQKTIQETHECKASGRSKSNMTAGTESVEHARESLVPVPNRSLLSTHTFSHQRDEKEVSQDTKTRYEETLLTGNWLKQCLQQSTTRSFPSITNLESMRKVQNSKPEHLDESDVQFEIRKSEDARSGLNTSTIEISQKTNRNQRDLYANSNSFSGQVINTLPPFAIHSWTNKAPEMEIRETDTQQSTLKFKTKTTSGTINLRPGSILSDRNSFQGQRDWIKDTMLAEKNRAQQNSDHKLFPSQTPLDDTVQVNSKTIESRQHIDTKKSNEGQSSQEVLDGEEAMKRHALESQSEFVKYDAKRANTSGLQSTLKQDRSMNEMLIEDACTSTKMATVPLLQNYKPFHRKGSSTKCNNVGKENADDTTKGNMFQLSDAPRNAKREEVTSNRENLFQNAALERSLVADTMEKSQGAKHVFVRPSNDTRINKKTNPNRLKKSAKGSDQQFSEQLKQKSNSRKGTVKNENMKVPRNFQTPNVSEAMTLQLQNYSIESMNKLAIGRNTRQSHLESMPNLSEHEAKCEQDSSDLSSISKAHSERISRTGKEKQGGKGVSFENSAFTQDQYFSVTDADKYEGNCQGSDIIYEECDNLSWASDDYCTNPMDSFPNKNPNSRSSTPSEDKNIQTTEETGSLQSSTPKMAKAQVHEDHDIMEYEAHTQLCWGLSATCEIPAYPSSNHNSNDSTKTKKTDSKIEKKKQGDEDFMEYQAQTQLSWGLSATCEIPAYPASNHKSSNSAATMSNHKTGNSNIKDPDDARTTNNKDLNRFKSPIIPTLSAYSNQALSFTEFMRDIQISSTEQCEDSPMPEIPASNQSVKTEQELIDEILNGVKYVRVPPESELIPATDINELINDLTFVW